MTQHGGFNRVKTNEALSTAARDEVGRPPHSGYVPPRLPSAPRERKPLLAALAVLLIIGGALASVLLVIRSSNLVSVVGIQAGVAAGAPIPASALTEVQVASNPAIDYVRWDQRELVIRLYAATDLVEGSLLVGKMVTPTRPASGQLYAGVALKPGQYPERLQAGDRVNVYFVDTEAQGGIPKPVQLLAENARVVGVGGESSSGTTGLTISVLKADAGNVAFAASAGKLALVLVPGPRN